MLLKHSGAFNTSWILPEPWKETAIHLFSPHHNDHFIFLLLAIPCTIEMTFEFRAHHPSAYSRFAILLLALIAINIFFISFFFSSLKSMNAAAEKSIILIVPWLLMLLLPSVILGIVVFRSFVNRYRL